MTRMTGPDCVVMCNLINTHTHTHTHIHTVQDTHINSYLVHGAGAGNDDARSTQAASVEVFHAVQD